MPLVVGVDAGGSRVTAAAQREGEAARVFAAEGVNANAAGVDATVEAIARAIEGALDGEAAAAIAVGAAGGGRSGVADALAHALRARFPGAAIAVSDDARIALRGAIPSGDGIALVAGTGSIAYAEIGDRTIRAGGGGFAFGDEGSGFAIGAAALRLLLRAFDGRGQRDEFLDALAEATGASDAATLAAFAYAGGAPVTAIASLAPVVLQRAGAGDRSATKIVQAAALDLFELVRAVTRRAGTATGDLPLAFAGGLLQSNSLLTYLVETRVANELPQLRAVKDGGAAFLGALAAARELLA